jgi:hypothetical protein
VHLLDSSATADANWHLLGLYTFDSQAINLALHQPTSQSSNDQGGVSSLAVDGMTNNGIFVEGGTAAASFSSSSASGSSAVGDVSGAATCMKTRSGQQDNWWRVDLGTVQSIEEVVVVGVANLKDNSSNHFHVRVGTQLQNTNNDLCQGGDADAVTGLVNAQGTVARVHCGTCGWYMLVVLGSLGVPIPVEKESPWITVGIVVLYEHCVWCFYVVVLLALWIRSM